MIDPYGHHTFSHKSGLIHMICCWVLFGLSGSLDFCDVNVVNLPVITFVETEE